MLTELKVKNFAIISNLHIQFGPGLNIISGETGAGKSIILKSLSLLMGQKGSPSIVRENQKQALVEGAFDVGKREDITHHLDKLGIETIENKLIVRRVLNVEGKSKVYVNDSIVALNTLRTIVAPLLDLSSQQTPLIEMTAQHDNRHLQNKTYHLDIIDLFGQHGSLRHECETQYTKIKKLKKDIQARKDQKLAMEQRLDFLKFQFNEINQYDFKPGEEDSLPTKISTLKNSHKILSYINQLEFNLYSSDNSCLTVLHRLCQDGESLAPLSSELQEKLGVLKQVQTLIEESIFDLRQFSKTLSTNEGELNQLEESLSDLRRLQKKYGQSIEEINDFKENLAAEIDIIENGDSSLTSLEKDLKQISELHKKQALELHKLRTKTSQQLAKLVNEELSDLNMKGVLFSIKSELLENPTASGLTDIEFLIQQNKSSQASPIGKIASGGELSRILLSLKKITGKTELPRTFLFDEVDTGVSGTTAEKVGLKLKSISSGQQVICVTHLPQVAAKADQHFLIEKENKKTHTELSMNRLLPNDQVKEIARLISGEKISKTSLAHARQLLK